MPPSSFAERFGSHIVRLMPPVLESVASGVTIGVSREVAVGESATAPLHARQSLTWASAGLSTGPLLRSSWTIELCPNEEAGDHPTDGLTSKLGLI
jgi:hypothetical protein